jgi:hypothetical protein
LGDFRTFKVPQIGGFRGRIERFLIGRFRKLLLMSVSAIPV